MSAKGVSAPLDAQCDRRHAAAIYRGLTGRWPDDAVIEDDAAFDTHVLASAIAVAASEDDTVHGALGLSAAGFDALLVRRFPGAWRLFRIDHSVVVPEDEEVAMLRELLLASRTADCDESRWLAAMIARRAVAPNHLWEDLGLRNRGELSRLLDRHFAPLARKNVRNMRWKRFFYRAMCESDGFVMCATPVCSACGDFAGCFGEETGESRLARARLEAARVVS